jgi:hypothetical protein
MAKTSISPDAARNRILARLVQRLKETAGQNLLGVAVYEVPAKPRVSGAAETNVLVVLADTSLPSLLPISQVLTSAQRQSQVVSFVATPAELHAHTELFPARLLEMRLSHRLLFGSAHLDDLRIAPRGLRFAALQELEALQIRVRQRIVERGSDPDQLWSGLVQSLPRLIAILETVAHARGGGATADAAPEALRRLAGEALDIDATRLEHVAALRLLAKRPNDEAVRSELADYLALLGELVRRLTNAAAADGVPPAVSDPAGSA